MSDKLLTYKQAAELLGFPVGTLRTWKMQGKLKSVQFGRAVRFQESYINQLISKGLGLHNGNLQEVR
jgi:excisionase family DNA binding protein